MLTEIVCELLLGIILAPFVMVCGIVGVVVWSSCIGLALGWTAEQSVKDEYYILWVFAIILWIGLIVGVCCGCIWLYRHVTKAKDE